MRVDVALTGFVVPAGAARARLVYAPVSWKIGLALSAVSLLILVGLVLSGAPPVGRDHA